METTSIQLSTFPAYGDNEYDWSLLIPKCVMGTICVVIVICNLFSLLVLYRIHDMHDVTKLLMMALTTTDIGVGLFGLTAQLLSHDQAIKLLESVVYLFQLLGLNILAMITIVRYIAVSRPLRLETLVTKRRAYISLVCTFLICLALYTNVFLAIFSSSEDTVIYIFLLYAYPSIPIVIVFIVYGKLLIISRHHARRIAAAEINAANAQAQLRRSNFKSLNTILIITGTTTVIWLPHIIGTLTSDPGIKVLFDSVHFSNSWLNTLIYYWRNESFRTVAKRLICRNARQHFIDT